MKKINHSELTGIIKIKVKPNSSENKIVDFFDGGYKVDIKAKAEKGKANLEVIKFFKKLTKKNVKILKGLKSREKVLKIY